MNDYLTILLYIFGTAIVLMLIMGSLWHMFRGLVFICSWMYSKLSNKPKCDHHYQGKIANGAGGSHLWCDKCDWEHYGWVGDETTKIVFQKIREEQRWERKEDK